jgi:hypothetical protein
MIRFDTGKMSQLFVDAGPLRDVQDSEGESEPRECVMNRQFPWQPRIETSFSARGEAGSNPDSFLPRLLSRSRRPPKNPGNIKDEA